MNSVAQHSPRPFRFKRAAGSLMVELLFTAALLAIVMLIAGTAMRAGALALQTTSVQSSLESKTADIMDRLVKELRDSGTKYANFAISTNQQSITFARCNGLLQRRGRKKRRRSETRSPTPP